MATNVYRGSDGTISVAVETGPEGDLASAINDEYGLTPVGRVSGVTVRVTNEVRPFHELGQRFATELRPGNINVPSAGAISSSATRAVSRSCSTIAVAWSTSNPSNAESASLGW